MRVQRFLGSAWATVHGAADPRRLLVATLEQGFAGLAVSPGPRPVDWAALRAAADTLPVEFAAVRVGNPMGERSATAGLASSKEGDRLAARAAIERTAGIARLLGCARVVMDAGVVPITGEIEAEDLAEPNYAWTRERAQALLARRKVGRDAAVDRVCRELYGVLKSFPDLHVSIAASRSVRAVADPDTLADIVADLGSRRLSYWHDAAVCARREQVLGEAQGEWLERFGKLLSGMSLGDASPEGVYLPPGAGGVDYGLCATYVPRAGSSFPVVLELDPSVAPEEMPGMRACLDKFGL